VRDDLDNNKPDFEKQLSDILGQPWTIDIKPLEIWPYAGDSDFAKQRTGSCIAA
jgi:hypothetical protein